MKVYLVGGAVRDTLLGLPIKEQDWVVVGAHPDDLLKLGYQKVGKSFPVFLHPDTREEYALARTERKSGQGYYGFLVDFRPTVTLEEDLLRRDLTINAIAKDSEGKLYDPYGGIADIQNKVIRHVSDAFIEDPVRVLRVARFMARFAPQGFRIHESTYALMREMVRREECSHLVPERVWQEWQQSLTEKDPTQFISVLRAVGALKVILPELDKMFGVPNDIIVSGSADLGLQSLALLQKAVNLEANPSGRFAVLLSALGKASTPIWFWPKHPGHEAYGVKQMQSLCKRLTIPNDYERHAVIFCQFHERLLSLYTLHAHDIVDVLSEIDAFRRPSHLDSTLILCKISAKSAPDTLMADWSQLRDLLANIDVNQHFPDLKGAAIKAALYHKRLALVTEWQNTRAKHEKKH